MWQVVIEFYALENNFFDERSIQTCSPFSCCSFASFQFKLDKFIFIITIDQAAGCNKIQLMCKWQLHAFLQNCGFKVPSTWLIRHKLCCIFFDHSDRNVNYMSHTVWTWWILVNFEKRWKWFWEWWFVVSTIALIVSFFDKLIWAILIHNA